MTAIAVKLIEELINLGYSIDFNEPILKMVERFSAERVTLHVSGIQISCIGGMSLRHQTYYLFHTIFQFMFLERFCMLPVIVEGNMQSGFKPDFPSELTTRVKFFQMDS